MNYVPKDLLVCPWEDSLNKGLLKEYINQRAHTIYSEVGLNLTPNYLRQLQNPCLGFINT